MSDWSGEKEEKEEGRGEEEGDEEEDWMEKDTSQLQKRIASVQAQREKEKEGKKKRSSTYKSEPASFAKNVLYHLTLYIPWQRAQGLPSGEGRSMSRRITCRG